jgi:hypothetical protein
MQPNGNTDYKKLLTEVIQKQMVVLGPGITLAKARNVKGLTVADDGSVTDIQGAPQVLIQGLIDQFVQLSGLIVKKTMEPLLSVYPDGVPTPIMAPPAPQQAPQQTPSADAAQEAINQALSGK